MTGRRKAAALASAVLSVTAVSCGASFTPIPAMIRQTMPMTCAPEGAQAAVRARYPNDFDFACDVWDGPACRQYWVLLGNLYGPTRAMTASLAPRIVAQFEKLCAHGEVESCTSAGSFLLDMPGQDARGRAFLEAACAAGSMNACALRAEAANLTARAKHELEGGDLPDVPIDELAMTRACAFGILWACDEGANTIWQAYGTDATTYWHRVAGTYACTWETRACAALMKEGDPRIAAALPPDLRAIIDEMYAAKWGTEYRDDKGAGLPDPKTAAAQLKNLARRCDAGDGGACFACGFGRAAGKHFNADDLIGKPTPEQYFERGCAAGSARACYALAAPKLRGNCPGADHVRGMPLMMRACDLGEPLACENLANIYDTGYGVLPSPDAGRRLHAVACARGLVTSCMQQ